VSDWFARVGLPLSSEESAALEALVGVVAPRATPEIALLTSWSDVSHFIVASERDATWWDQEEEEREWLWTRATEQQSESALLQRIASLHAGLDAAVRAAAAAAGAGGTTLVNEAAGSVLLAAQQDALAEMAGEPPGHRFRRKFALFARGRWPLGYHAARFVIF